MTLQRRPPRALALACCITALSPAGAIARPAIDPPAFSARNAAAADAGVQSRGRDDGLVSSETDTIGIATAAGGALLIVGVAAQITRRRRRARTVPSGT